MGEINGGRIDEREECTPQRDGNDELLWKADKSKKYTVKLAYRRFYNENKVNDNDQFARLLKCRALPST